VALVCSGTATLEAAIRQKPMVVVYRGSWLMNLEWRLRKKRLAAPFIGMPNLIAGRAVAPEMLQDEASPENMAAAVIDLLTNSVRSQQMRDDLADVARRLGRPGAVGRTAGLAVAMAHGTWDAQTLALASVEQDNTTHGEPVAPAYYSPDLTRRRPEGSGGCHE
jgi:lipid-A-disaccharide synthase